MPTYKAPVEEVLFLLTDVLGMERFHNLPGFGEMTEDLVAAIVSEAGRFCGEVLHPLNQAGDRPRLHPSRRRGGDDTARLQGSLSGFRRGGLARARRRSRLWRPGTSLCFGRNRQ